MKDTEAKKWKNNVEDLRDNKEKLRKALQGSGESSKALFTYVKKSIQKEGKILWEGEIRSEAVSSFKIDEETLFIKSPLKYVNIFGDSSTANRGLHTTAQ